MAHSSPPGDAASRKPTPTLDDVAQLTPDSDFKPYIAPEVDACVRNEALRKLFHEDPHFHQGDDLDVRVDEQHEISRSAQARQHTIEQARALGLLDDELLDQPGSELPDDQPAG